MMVNEEMAAALMHEVKNPVGLIKMNVDYIKKESGSRWEKNFTVIEKELSKLNRLFDDYKALITKTEDGSRERIFLKDLINDIIEEYDISLADKKIDFSVSCGEDVSILGDYNKICILFFNLIKNAVEAIDKAGSISIFTEESDGKTITHICDSGCGMDSYISQNIGKPFVTGKANGSGLGMLICRSIAKEHGGSVEITNRAEKGCHVTVTL